MARSRIGGTRGLLRGKVGDYIYQITRNINGEFVQKIYAGNQDPLNPSTDGQICARASMACIERAMFTYYDLIYNSFRNVPAGLMSLNRFSDLNYPNVRQQFDFYYQDADWKETPYDYPRKRNTMARGGAFTISQGNLNSNINMLYYGSKNPEPYFIIQTRVPQPHQTVLEWHRHHMLRIGDILDFAFFVDGTSPSYNFLGRIQMYCKQNQNPNQIITSSNFRTIFNINSNVLINSVYNNETGAFFILWQGSTQAHNKAVTLRTCKITRYKDGFYDFNNAELMPSDEVLFGDAGWNTPHDVFTNWNQI